MWRWAWVCLSCLCAAWAHAGSQREEPLADSVRTVLSAAVVVAGPPPSVVHPDANAEQAYTRWLERTETQLAQQLKKRSAGGADAPTHELANVSLRREFLQTVWYESQRAGLPVDLVLGLIQVESGFRKFAISSAGARGYTQVMPFWTRQLSSGDASVLFQAQANLRFGCVILRHYLDVEEGNLHLALGRYNGSRGQMQYPNAVLAAQRLWQ
jgi:soluble lytic murein transglycosylase-like protein